MVTLYKLGVILARVCFRLFAQWKVEGEEGVLPKGPLLIICNHLSNADPPVLAASMHRRIHFMGKQTLFSNPLSSWFLRRVGVYPLSRTGKDISALRWILGLLEKGEVVAVFPEGTRSPSGLKRAIPGVAYIAAKSQATVLPVALTGTENVGSLWRVPFPLCRINVKIGMPFSLPLVEGVLGRQVLEHLTDIMMYRIAAMLPDSYRGYYGSEPDSSSTRNITQ